MYNLMCNIKMARNKKIKPILLKLTRISYSGNNLMRGYGTLGFHDFPDFRFPFRGFLLVHTENITN